MHVCVHVCEEEVLKNAGNVHCSLWEGVMGGRLLCFMVLGIADLGLAPVSRDQVVQKNPNNKMCMHVCMCALFAHPSFCGRTANNQINVCAWAPETLSGDLKLRKTKNKKGSS